MVRCDLWLKIYLLNDTVNVSEELAQGQSDSGINPLLSKALRNASQADKDPEKKNREKQRFIKQ